MGVGAGVIDVIPMVIQRLDRYACISAFIHWVVLGVIISYVEAPIRPWLKGLLVGVAASLSIVVIVAKADPRSIPPILCMSALLGALVGLLSARFAR